LLRSLQSEKFESGRRNTLSIAASYNYFSCLQLAEIFQILQSSSEKIYAAQVICPKIVDKQNSHIPLSILSFSSEKEQVAKFF
jgi:hypothetical protein